MESENKPTFFRQLKAMLTRNFILKKRERRKTLAEMILPLYFLLILVIIKLLITDPDYEAITEPQGQASLFMQFAILGEKPIHLIPDTDQVRNFSEEIQKTSDILASFRKPLEFRFISNEQELLDLYYGNDTDVNIALFFEEDPFSSTNYTIRNNPQTRPLPSSNVLWGDGASCRAEGKGEEYPLELGYSCPVNQYFYSNILPLQSLVENTWLRLNTPDNFTFSNITLQIFPKPQYTDDTSLTVMRALVPFYMVMVLSQFITYLLMLVVGEKEKKIKEGLAMMGLRDSVYWLSWFLIYICFVLVVSSISTGVLFACGVFINANGFLVFIILFLYGISVISLAFMLTPFFDKARVAGVFGGMAIFFVNILYYVQVMASGTNVTVFWLISLLSPTAFALAMDKAVLLDITGEGLNWSTLWNGPDMPFAGALIMIMVDIVLYAFLAFYFDSVVPSEFGAKKPPWFFLMPSYWCRGEMNTSLVGHDNDSVVVDEIMNGDIEPVPRNLRGREALRIQSIFKSFYQFRKPEVKAVQGISLDVYEGQITAILGHNGAGKTTLFNMLTGMTLPTKGTAKLYGLDIRNSNDMSEIRRFTGVCPQHDVLFDLLTPKEHLEFFANMRGVPPSKIEKQVHQTLEDLVLTSKSNSPASKLSGGQKRKLSIGISLIGDPKIIFLDEPTAGVDPYSRRHLWSLLQKRKEGKVILLTTHFMDEADLLADRKAIVSHGDLRCCGSSLFLKNRFGIGYHLTFVMKQDSKVKDLETLVKSHVQGAEITRHYGKELSFILPREEAANFPKLFFALEDGLDQEHGNNKLGFMSYGVSMTTLEEVFLKLGEEEEAAILEKKEKINGIPAKTKASQAAPICPADAVHINADDIKPSKSQTFKALLRLRILNTAREPMAVFFQVFMPVMFAALGIYLGTLQTVHTVDGPLNLNLSSSYGNQWPLLYNVTDSEQMLIDAFSKYTQQQMEQYSGDFAEILELAPHEAAFDSVNGLLLRYNDTFQHIPPMVLNAMHNTFLQMKNPDVPSIEATLYPLPSKSQGGQFDAGQFTSAMFIGMVFIFAPTGLVMDMVMDRETKCRNQLRVNGLTFGLYFGSFFVIMGTMMIFTTLLVLGLIAAFQLTALTVPAAYGLIALLYILYCPTGLLMASCASYFFNKMETAQSVFPNLAMFAGFLPYLITIMCDMLQVGGSTQVATILHCIFSFTDTLYIPFASLYYINRVYIKCWLTSGLDVGRTFATDSNTCDHLQFSDYMTTEIIVILAAIIVQMPIYFVLLMIIDVKKGGGLAADAFPCLSQRSTKVRTSAEDQETLLGDSDVSEERQRVQELARDPSTKTAVLVHDLRKVYEKGPEEQASTTCRKGIAENEKLTAVKSLSVAVDAGEVFGLLGHNGAGKTTTLRMIIAEESATAGRIKVSGIDVRSNLNEAFQAMGYCPQHDAQWKNITVKEHLEIFSAIRGVPPELIPKLVGAYLEGLQIEEHANKQAKNCSGGTKRKLSYSASMLGRPGIVLLDEPSTGMDPQSKRFLWDTISASFKGKRGAILTTHSMEEADALCARVGIMVKGELRCLGSSQHLKNRYGSGYVLEIKLKTGGAFHESHDEVAKRREKLQHFVKGQFPASEVRESFEDRLIFEVPQKDMLSLAGTFAALEQARSSLDIEEYSFSQTTLEQVFLKFAQLQEDPDNDGEEDEYL